MVRGLLPRSALIAGALVSALAGVLTAQLRPWSDHSPHRAAFIGIDSDVALEVLDWGGTGPPFILLAGLGNTAHVFDDFARHFTDRFHVFGVTRRGYGSSSRPESGYDVATLAHDIAVLCDRLHFDRVILVGHSIAGDELTKFASTYPARVTALVYLDAAHDRTTLPPTDNMPQQRPLPDDLLSIERYSDYVARTMGGPIPEAEVRAFAVLDSTGKLVRGSTPASVGQAVLAGVEHPRYQDVHAPALAIYAGTDVHSAFPNYAAFDDDNKRRAEQSLPALKGFQETNVELFRRQVIRGRVAQLASGSHYVFLTAEAEVVRLIREFLAQLPT